MKIIEILNLFETLFLKTLQLQNENFWTKLKFF